MNVLAARQLRGTGLQVAKDPGVWLVYLGCGLMLVGLVTAFFLSHRRIWLFLREEEGGTAILFVGSTNKNRAGFRKTFARLAERLQNS